MRSLVFVGCNFGPDVTKVVQDYDLIWLFEPITEIALTLAEEFHAEQYRDKAIMVVNAACWTDNETRPFRIYNTNGLSSSLGTITEQAVETFSGNDLSLFDERTCRCVRLDSYLPAWLTSLVIDAQGADLTILKTIEPWLTCGRIEAIQIECDGDGFKHYEGLEDNSESSLVEYMRQFPYTATRVPDRSDANPDYLFVRK